jgi:hypothetical protein
MEIERMENKTKYILTAVIIFVVLLAAAFAYQQKTIMNLKDKIGGGGQGDLGGSQNAALNSPFTVKAVQDTITNNTKQITGIVTAKTDNSLTVEAELVDTSKLAGVREEVLTGNEASLPKVKKSYQVLVNDQTQYPSMKFKDMATGIKVLVDTNDLIYRADSIVASKITLLSVANSAVKTSDTFLKEIKDIIGPIKEIGGNYLIVEVSHADYSKIKDIKNIAYNDIPNTVTNYRVSVDEKTQFIGKKLGELKMGDNVQAFSDGPVYNVSEFTAAKIGDAPQRPNG